MAKLVLGVGSSHGPSIQSPPERWAKLAEGDTRDPRFDYQAQLKKARPGLESEIALDVQRHRHAGAHAALRAIGKIVADARLDLAIVVSNAHRIRPGQHQPVFSVIGCETFPVSRRADEPFDPDSRFVSEEKRGAAKTVSEAEGNAAFAAHLLARLIEDQFDVSYMEALPQGAVLDDAFVFPSEYMFGGVGIPIVPFNISRDLPNQPTPRRCFDLGGALRRAIEAWPGDIRVGLVSSGGLSHQIIDEELDRGVIDALAAGDRDALCAVPRDRLNGSPGTPEILNWIAVAAAMAPTRMTLVDYLPAYRSVAGTGHGLTFGYWK
ncbi:MAG: hypothetical protein ACM30I_12005 [Gemmatimonas sp.]